MSASAASIRWAARARGEAVERGAEAEVLAAGQLEVEARLLEHHAESRAVAGVAAVGRLAVERQRPGVRRDEAGQQAKGGRLAGAVRAEQAEDLAGRDVEAEAVERGALLESAGEAGRPKPRHAFRRRALRRRGGDGRHAMVLSITSATNSSVR